jgi:hypothetical protein
LAWVGFGPRQVQRTKWALGTDGRGPMCTMKDAGVVMVVVDNGAELEANLLGKSCVM